MAGKYHCNYCDEDINDIRVKCNECQDFDLCLQCFSCGAEIGSHRSRHSYQLIVSPFTPLRGCRDCGTFPILTTTHKWRALDEIALLEAIEQYGFGNWTAIADSVGLKDVTSDEAKEHYCSYYVLGSIGRAVWNQVNTDSSVAMRDHTCPNDGPLSPGLTTPLPAITEVSRQDEDALGYLPKRDDFEREFDNECESLVSTLSVNNSEDDDLEISLKLAHVSMYQKRLKERFERKGIAREYGLVSHFFKSHNSFKDLNHSTPQKNANCLNKKNSKQSSSQESESESPLKSAFEEKYKPFIRFQSEEESRELFKNMKREKELKAKIKELMRYRKNGLKRRSEVIGFESARNKRQKRKENKKKSVSDVLLSPLISELFICFSFQTPSAAASIGSVHKRSLGTATKTGEPTKDQNSTVSQTTKKGTKVSSELAPKLVNNQKNEFDVSSLPGCRLLSDREKKLCSTVKLRPSQYITLKTLILKDHNQRGTTSSSGKSSLENIDKSTCRRVEGVFDLDKLRVGYNDILLIPSGAYNIRIEERFATNNYLAVRNINGQYYLNGNWRIQFPKTYVFAGTTFHYYSKRKPFGIQAPESLRAVGPLTEPLVIVLLYRERNKGLFFEFTVPADAQTPVQHSIYSWIYSDYSQCSRTCGTGIQTRNVHCVRVMDHLPVSDSLCDSLTRPDNNRTCNADPCAAWKVAEWTDCLCHFEVQYRHVYCHSSTQSSNGGILEDTECLQLNQPKPSSLQKCVRETECPVWTTGVWERCDSNCGNGTQTREVNCTLKGETVNESQCVATLRPIHTQECNEIPCDGVEWFVTDWTSCDKQCGPQVQTRKAICADESGTAFPSEACGISRTPATSQLCTEQPPCAPLWFTSEWSNCSVDCGEGLQTRHVFCAHLNDKSEVIVDSDSECVSERPQNVSVCRLSDCEGIWFSAPYEMCTVPCSGGQMSRKVICFNQSDELVLDESCDTSLKPLTKEDCNTFECDDDQLIGVGGCKDTKSGCCPDGLTPAGDGYSECPPINMTDGCNATQFGCCPDLETAAFGPFLKGCQVLCNFTRFGCCPDGLSIANSTTFEECPQPIPETTTVTTIMTTTEEPTTTTTTEVPVKVLAIHETKECDESLVEGSGEGSGEGCADGTDIGEGQKSEGSGDVIVGGDITNCTDSTCVPEITTDVIDCNATEFGCCPTGKKAATGPRYYGCTCEDFPNGCCQDKYTPARGPDFDGCICSRMLYGCCSDGVTPAIGANYEGCSCESSMHGCCPDMVSISKGPNYAGCPCDSLSFGCCPGSTIPATGPKFEGCSCANTPFGCCHDGVTIAYGPKFEGCPSGPSLDLKLVSEVCGLSKERGSCRNFTVKWYFDVAYGGCNRFWYGGCEGNGNRFSSQEQCERSCVSPEGPERCALPKVSGPCNGSYVLWYFNPEARSCEQFVYGGCLGNTNRYETKDICEQTCVHQETILDRCEQPPSVGPCRGNYERWHYRKEENRCLPFTYGGCKGNQNNFQSEEECRNSCGSQSPQEICGFPKAEGPCLGSFPRWYFDSTYSVCREFVYSGCEGNRNRFVDKSACERQCNQTKVLPIADNVCSLPRAEGPCRAAIIQWYFNTKSGRCERFYYGGCEGNGNRFDDRTACERSCLYVHSDRNACHQPKESGNCYDYRERWHYDVEDKRCHRFYYSGCKGNENNFGSFEECTQRCGPFTVVSTELSVQHFKTEFCFKSYDSGPCFQNEIRWFYDRTDGVCKEFLYGGCDGNENRFTSRSDCEAKCWNSQDICRLSKVVGSCSGRFTQWYFDVNANECLEFLFSGCHGNANRYNSKEMCETQCQNRGPYPSSVTAPTANICDLPHEAGVCKGYFPRWHYSREDNACKQFIFGGCAGNENRFENREECENRCLAKTSKPIEGPGVDDSSEVVCRLDVESGPCRQTEAFWFYDPQSHNCLPFVYGGCNGNKNRFKTYEVCMRFCSHISPIQTPIPTEIKPSTKSYDCPPSDCEDQRCPFGIDEFVDERGCSACRCSNPCYVFQCPEDKSCAVEVYRAERGEPRAQPVCRLRNKPGICPPDISSSNVLASDCVDRCRNDADCRGDDKCCNNGCADICVLAEGITPNKSLHYDPNQLGGHSTQTEVLATPGSDVTIDCFLPTQSAQVSWNRDGQPLYLLNERVQILPNGSLSIKSLENEDAGTYECTTDNVNMMYTKLTINAYDANSYRDAVATIPINVNSNRPLSGDCEDSQYFANCEIIVKAKYCNNPHYAKFCCRSCFLAGQLECLSDILFR
ncbi:unnamed protein product [Oppiella nova]|uniref:Papilin n=1 Tax=Oppiella nova TaxID=334625 RepID=A0A7R9L866_9ACAR|nr:unnamed protein product [Oppiella nova]CAG2158354.1 unnamed protein product [Oppiella nova]